MAGGDDKDDLEPEDSNVETQKLERSEIRKLLEERGVDPSSIDMPSDEPNHTEDEDDAG